MSVETTTTSQVKYNSGRVDALAYASPNKKTKEQLQKELEKKRARDAELIVGRFVNTEQAGMSLTFCYQRYKGQKIEKYKFLDNEIYQIPRGVRNHIKSLSTPVYEHLKGYPGVSGGSAFNEHQMPGMSTMQVKKRKPRFTWLDLDYMEDIDTEVGTNIMEVSYVDTGRQVR